jgi:hypothetical protein
VRGNIYKLSVSSRLDFTCSRRISHFFNRHRNMDTTTPSEKPGATPAAATHHEKSLRTSSQRDEISRIDAIAEAPETTMESFAHLDEKKILRKVRWYYCHLRTAAYIYLDGHATDPHVGGAIPLIVSRP